MYSDIKRHHELEAEVDRLRKRPDHRDEDEELLLDEMEEIWYRLSSEGIKLLETERKRIFGSKYR